MKTEPPARNIAALLHLYRGRVPGVSVLVLRAGQPLYRACFGYADLEAATAATAATNYRLASVSKQFTAAAVLLLAQDGRVALDDPIRRWLPELPAAAQGMRIRQLLTHRAGLIDYEDLVPAGTTRQLRDADVLRLLAAQDRSYFAPGTQYRYSNSGYALLSLIVARAAGRDFATFLRERIFLPLGMRGTVAREVGAVEVEHRAFGYSAAGEAWRRTDQSLTSAVLGDGGLYSSIDDLACWDAALYDSRLLSEASRAQAFAPATATEDPAVSYGFGWRITGESLWHSGETLGFRNVILRFPRERFSVIVLANRSEAEPYALAWSIAQLYLPGAAAVRASSVVAGPDCGALKPARRSRSGLRSRPESPQAAHTRRRP